MKKPKSTNPKSLKKMAEPFILTPEKKINSSNTRKYLTNPKRWNIMELVRKAKERTNKMAQDKNTKTTRTNAVKSASWLFEAAFRGYIGWMLLANFHNYLTMAAGIYALGTAAVIVITHFFKAHK